MTTFGFRRSLILAALVCVGAANAQNSPGNAAANDAQMGTPITGAAGITERVSTIMDRARAEDARGPRPEFRKFEFENEYRHPENRPDSPAVSSWPPTGSPGENGAPGTRAAQTVGTPNFTGATLADTSAFPPDTMGAVGPSQFIVAVNGRIRSFNKLTGVADGALNASADAFFNSVMTPPTASNFTSDPRIRYDRLTGRWFVIIIDVPGGTGNQANRVLLAVSSGSTISASTDFTFYQFQMSTTLFADYPTLGIDANALYIGANMFTFAGGFSSTLGSVVRKTSVLSGGPIVTTTFTMVATGAGAGPFTPQGVDNYDTAATEGYFVGVSNVAFGQLDVRRVSDPAGTPTLSGNLSVVVPSTTFPPKVPHSGNTGGNNGRLDSLDDRLFAAHLRNGRLWTAHNISTNASGVGTGTSRASTRWYELGTLTTTPSLIQSGTVFSTAASNPESYFIPSIMVSGQGHAALGFSMAGNSLSPNAGTIGRLSGDTLGTTQGPISNYTGSTFAYNPTSDPGGAGGRRWGDYSYTSLDPCDDMTMWTIQEFASSTNVYGVRVVRLLAPAPTATSCPVATDIEQGQSGVALNLAGTGFFEPAASVGSCRTLIGASVSGSGITIAAPTFNSSSSLGLSVSASGAAALGPRTITVTNPDGQTVVASGCINVVAPAAETVLSINRVGSGSVCVGETLSWQATFSAAVAGVTSSNFSLNGGTGATISGLSGSGDSRTVSVNSGTAAGLLRLDMVNSTGVTPALTGLPFNGQAVTISANPSAFSVTGGGSYCANGTGVAVGLSGSEVGVNYQLMRGAVAVGAPLAGTGAAISFGTQTIAGNYSVDASNVSSSCGTAMSGSATVSIDANPTAFAVSGGGSYCAGGPGVAVGLGGSQSGVNYQLRLNGAPTGSPLAGTGSALAFGNQTSAGNYTVSATDAGTSCAATMTGGAAVVSNPIPSVNAQTPATICSQSSTSITLSSNPAGSSFAYGASNTAGSVTGFAAGSSNPIAQALTGSGAVTYAVVATLNSCPSSERAIVQSVTNPQPADASLPAAVQSGSYSFALTAPGSLQPAVFSVVAGSLPAGLSLSPAGLLSGTPSAIGVSNFSVRGTDSSVAGCGLDRAYSLEVRVAEVFSDGFE